ncbi:hypothetical protein INT45_003220 [Circinella minor]|uniref:Uncharacterized protein n=1 Tax=Circinella minor TaxID=1195481 RepID=A0A8H7VLH5_9FUNG|nr:hypothetical protein INT45_003220 [Circinella minor]
MYRQLATLSTTRRITNSYSRLRIQPATILHGNRSLTSTITPLPLGVTTKRAFTVTTVNFQAQQSMEEDMNNIEELFSIAKDEMEYAQESIGSVYYHEDRVTAENAVNECLEAFNKFLADLPSDEMRNEVQGKVGMKIKKLKMEYDSLPEEGG